MNKSSLELLDPTNCVLILIDHQPQMFFGVESTHRETIINNVTALAKTAKVFNVPTILTTVAAKTFSGPLIPQVQSVFPDIKPIDRTSMNSWEDKNFVDAVKKTGRKKLVIAALWTEVCLAFPALSALQEGYEVYAVLDASGGTTKEAHKAAVGRMLQAGVVPVTWVQFMCELQRDWARQETYGPVVNIAQEHAGAYGIGIFYSHSMSFSNSGETKEKETT